MKESLDSQIKYHKEQAEFHEQEAKRLLSNVWYCFKCTYYSPKEDWQPSMSAEKTIYREHPSCEFDDAALYDCTCITHYRICPNCGARQEIRKEYIDLHNKRYV